MGRQGRVPGRSDAAAMMLQHRDSTNEQEPTALDRFAGVDPGYRWRHAVLLSSAALLWIWAIARADQSDLGDYGLVTILPVSGFLALALALGGYLHAVRIDRTGRLLGTYVIGLIAMVHGVGPMVYDHLRFSWAWKHVGIVEFIQRTGGVDRQISELPVYHNWPAFFGVSAGVNAASGLDTALVYAAWAPLVWNLLFAGALLMLFRSLTSDHRLTWTAILMFSLGNWVGQDYFAPQSAAFLLYLLVIAMLLRWYTAVPLGPGGIDPNPEDHTPERAPESFVLSLVIGMMLLALSATHQLTPIMTILALAGLTFFKVIRVRWPLVAMVVFTAAWLLGPARTFFLDSIGTVFGEVGGVQTNLENTLVSQELFGEAQFIVSRVARLLSGILVFLAGLGLLQRTRHRLSVRWSIVLASIPALLVVVSSYGGEIIFRAYLFALPVLAFLAASVWFPTPGARHLRVGRASLGVTVFVLTGALLLAAYGTDNRQVFSDDEVAAAEFVYSNAEAGALVVEGTRDYPRQFRNYADLRYLALDRSSAQTLDLLEDDAAGLIAQWLRDEESYNSGFVILTGSQRKSVSALGPSLGSTLDGIEASLRASDEFEVAFEAGSAVVFALAGES